MTTLQNFHWRLPRKRPPASINIGSICNQLAMLISVQTSGESKTKHWLHLHTHVGLSMNYCPTVLIWKYFYWKHLPLYHSLSVQNTSIWREKNKTSKSYDKMRGCGPTSCYKVAAVRPVCERSSKSEDVLWKMHQDGQYPEPTFVESHDSLSL